MTRKGFQLSRLLMIAITIYISVVLLQDERIYLLDGDMRGRCAMEFLCLLVFLGVSHLYEKKIKIFSVGYLFILINIFSVGTLGPFYFTNSRLLEAEVGGATMPGDHFWIYMAVYFIIMLIITVYLLCVKSTTDEIQREDFIRYTNKDDIAVLLCSALIVLPLMEMTGSSGTLLGVPILAYFFVRILCSNFNPSQSLTCMAGLLLGLYALYRVRYNRYLVVEYAMPLIVIFLIYVAVHDSRKRGKIVVPLGIAGVIAFWAYGMISEIVKLNMYWDGEYSLMEELLDFTSVIDFFERQIFRIFGIWTQLGGNIIEHVQLNGFYHGITYIKFLAPYLGFEYVSLPTISAKYILATYAQPGLIAEGYANFGIFGAVINLLIPFILAEVLLKYFLKKRDAFSICLLGCSFVKVLIDGGTINSIIVGAATCCLVFAAYLVFDFAGVKLNDFAGARIRVFRKKKYMDVGHGEEDINHSAGL